MFEKIRIIFTIPELRQKILLTLGLLAIYRVGWQVPLPIVDPAAMRDPTKNTVFEKPPIELAVFLRIRQTLCGAML